MPNEPQHPVGESLPACFHSCDELLKASAAEILKKYHVAWVACSRLPEGRVPGLGPFAAGVESENMAG